MTTGEKNTKFDGESEANFNEMRKFFRENFNTDLSPEDEFRFHDWSDAKSKAMKRDLLDDLDNYDLRGAYMECCDCEEDDISWPCRFKKPNHPTFAIDSIYHGAVDQHQGGTYEGGEWGHLEDGTGTFTPSKKMLESTHPKRWIAGFFRTEMPDIELMIEEEQEGE